MLWREGRTMVATDDVKAEARRVADELTAAAVAAGTSLSPGPGDRSRATLPGGYAVIPVPGPGSEQTRPLLCRLKDSGEPWYALNLDYGDSADRWVPGEEEAREFLRWEGAIRDALR
jgi:hypothetical protein